MNLEKTDENFQLLKDENVILRDQVKQSPEENEESTEKTNESTQESGQLNNKPDKYEYK